MTSNSLTVVLPCYNEEARITRSLTTLDRWFGSTIEVLVVDDGSSDGTLERVRTFADAHSNVRAHRISANHGKGFAVRTALALTRTQRVVVMDADLAFDRASVVRVADALDSFDMAVGNRRHHDSYYAAPVRLFGFLYRRHLVGLAFNLFVRMLLQVGLPDTQCGLKGYRRASLERVAAALTIDGFATDVEILVVARALGLRMVDVPVCVTYESARSSVNLIRSGIAMGSDVIRIAVQRLTGTYSRACPPALSATAGRTASPPPRTEQRP